MTRRPSLFLLALGLSCGLLPAQDYDQSVSSRVLAKTDTTAAGQKVAYPSVKHPEVTSIEVEIPPGGETGWHTHPFPGYAYILAGELTVETRDGRSRTFRAGETILESVGILHNGRNRGAVPVRLVAFFTGEKGKPFTVRAEKAVIPKR